MSPIPTVSSQTGSLPSTTFHQHPGTIPTIVVPGQDDLAEHIPVLSPLPDIRRGSHIEFDFPLNIPVPREFADLSRKNSMQEGGKDAAQERYPISIEDIEVRIQSSTDNLLDVDEDEPYTFEEKSIKEIRDSLANSLNNSIDIDEDGEYQDERIEEEHREEEKSSTKEESGDEEKEKTEALDSDETDETVRESRKVEGQQKDDEEMADDETPEGDTNVIEDMHNIQTESQEPSVSGNRDLEEDLEHTDKQKDKESVTDTEEEQKDDTESVQKDQEPRIEQEEQRDAKDELEAEDDQMPPDDEVQTIEEQQALTESRREVGPGREKPVGEEAPEETPSIQTQDDVPEITDDDGEAPPPSSERIVEGAEALTEDEMEDEEKGEKQLSSSLYLMCHWRGTSYSCSTKFVAPCMDKVMTSLLCSLCR